MKRLQRTNERTNHRSCTVRVPRMWEKKIVKNWWNQWCFVAHTARTKLKDCNWCLFLPTAAVFSKHVYDIYAVGKVWRLVPELWPSVTLRIPRYNCQETKTMPGRSRMMSVPCIDERTVNRHLHHYRALTPMHSAVYFSMVWLCTLVRMHRIYSCDTTRRVHALNSEHKAEEKNR